MSEEESQFFIAVDLMTGRFPEVGEKIFIKACPENAAILTYAAHRIQKHLDFRAQEASHVGNQA